VQWSIEQGRKKRREPTADQVELLASRPELDLGALELAHAYAKLSTTRPITAGGLGPIPITAVWQWEDRNGITDPGLRRHVEAVIASVDVTAIRRSNRPTSASAPSSDLPDRRRSKR
jgi:hypothetical protein